MSQSTALKLGAALLVLASTALASLLAVAWDRGPGGDTTRPLPGITLGLTAEAREALQQPGDGFLSAEAGFSIYYQVPDGEGGSGLDKAAVDRALLDDETPTPLRAGIGQAVRMGDNYTVARVPILNIGGLVSEVHVYYDSQGWIVAYVAADGAGSASPSSQVWQARDLNDEIPNLTDVSRTTLLDAINDILAAVGASPVGPEQAGYYHWGFPQATSFLMVATARGTAGADYVSFSVPDSFNVLEASVSMWASLSDTACARLTLDDANLTGDQCNTGFYHAFAVVADFNSRTVHTMKLEQLDADVGGAGALVMLIYSAPSP